MKLEDVAEKTGLSRATISRVIRNYPGVREKTRKKVLKAIKEMNYEVNTIARSLREKKTNTVGFIFGKVFDLFFSRIVKRVETIANDNGYKLILSATGDDPEKELESLKTLNSLRVEGMIIISSGKNSKYINRLISSGMKVVLLDRLIEGVECNAVIVDNNNGGYLAAKHLLDKGYKRIGIVNGNKDITTGKERLNGYLRALTEAGIDIDNEIIKNGDFSKECGYEYTKELLCLKNRPDAIFTTNLDLTLGALRAIGEKKILIPDSIGIIGFDDAEWASLISPKLSVINYPLEQFGSIAVDLLIKEINGSNSINNVESKPQIIKLDTFVIEREST